MGCLLKQGGGLYERLRVGAVLLAAGDHAGPTNVTGMRPPRLPDRFPDRFFELDLRECECKRRLVPR